MTRIYTGLVRSVFVSVLLITVCAVAGCRKSPSAPSNTITLAMMAGTWRTTTAATGACTGITYTITPTSLTTANITFTATCVGVPISGSGTGTLNVTGTTFNWTMSGTAGPCAFSLTGTAVPLNASDLAITYTGTVCGAPVSGSETLHR